MDSQSVASGGGGGEQGYDAGKKTKGRKRHILVDTLGLLLAVVVTAASVPDAVAGEDLLALTPPWDFPHLQVIWVDQAYDRQSLRATAEFFEHATMEVIRRAQGISGWQLLPKRWVVERTFAWLVSYRRHARDYETNTDSSEAMIHVSMVALMLNRLKPKPRTSPFR